MKEFEKDLADGEEAGTVAEGTSTPSANGAHTSLNNPPPAPLLLLPLLEQWRGHHQEGCTTRL